MEKIQQQDVIPIDSLVPNVHYQFNVNELRLDITVPQVALKQSEANYVDPRLWNYGEPAIIFLIIQTITATKKNTKTSSDNFYATLNSGVN